MKKILRRSSRLALLWLALSVLEQRLSLMESQHRALSSELRELQRAHLRLAAQLAPSAPLPWSSPLSASGFEPPVRGV